MARNEALPISINGVFVLSKIKGRGTSNTISISNTIKMMARRKNRMENGTRALWLGSNPHSNGEDFSRSVNVRIARTQDSRNKINGIMIAIDDEISSRFIN